MSKYIQLHILTSYPASNLNRDDLGQPKTVIMGNRRRLRVSSQSLKRAWRTSPVFSEALGGHLGTRTKELGVNVFLALTLGLSLQEAIEGTEVSGDLATVSEAKAIKISRVIGGVFGKIKKEEGAKEGESEAARLKRIMESMEIEQLAHLTPAEIEGVAGLVEVCRESGKEPEGEALELLRQDSMAADVAMFGRMLAASKRHNVDAAVQVAHAMTVHSAEAEDDFFTAVDDLNREDAGAGHMGVTEFGAGLFYLYICIDKELLTENLNGNGALANKAIEALMEAACTVSPTGKQNSFASRARAIFCLAEKGADQPRSLSVAYLKSLDEADDLASAASGCLLDQRKSFAQVYGDNTEALSFNAMAGEGSLAEMIGFITE